MSGLCLDFCLFVDIQLFQYNLLKILSLLHWIAFAPLSKIHIYAGLFLGSLFCSIDLSILWPKPLFFKKIYLSLAALGLRCFAWAFSLVAASARSRRKQGLLLDVVRGLLIMVASRCGARALGARASVVAKPHSLDCQSFMVSLKVG